VISNVRTTLTLLSYPFRGRRERGVFVRHEGHQARAHESIRAAKDEAVCPRRTAVASDDTRPRGASCERATSPKLRTSAAEASGELSAAGVASSGHDARDGPCRFGLERDLRAYEHRRRLAVEVLRLAMERAPAPRTMNRAALVQRVVVRASARARVLERLVPAADAVAVVGVVRTEASADRTPFRHERWNAKVAIAEK
jgi:hypothetical protein